MLDCCCSFSCHARCLHACVVQMYMLTRTLLVLFLLVVFVIVALQRLLLVSGDLSVLASIDASCGSVGLATGITSLLWVGPALLYMTAAGQVSCLGPIFSRRRTSTISCGSVGLAMFEACANRCACLNLHCVHVVPHLPQSSTCSICGYCCCGCAFSCAYR